jgi:hypothetical protein
MKTTTQSKALYEAPRLWSQEIHIETSILSVEAGGQNVTFEEEDSFDNIFKQ